MRVVVTRIALVLTEVYARERGGRSLNGLFVVFFCFFWCVCSFARERASERASVCTGRGAVDTRIAANPKGFFAPKIERSGLIIVTRVRGLKLTSRAPLFSFTFFVSSGKLWI